MKDLQVIEHQNQRILTTQQLAESYGSDPKTISYNFNYNKDRYMEGIDFYCLEGEELQAFKNNYSGNSRLVEPHAPKLYLWTESGTLMHAKSLNTDTAWEVYRHLVETYFRYKEQQAILRVQPLQGWEPNLPIDDEEAMNQLIHQEQTAQRIGQVKLRFLQEIRDSYHDTPLARKQRRQERKAERQLAISEKIEEIAPPVWKRTEASDFSREAIKERCIAALEKLGSGWYGRREISQAGATVLRTLGSPRTGAFLDELVEDGHLLREGSGRNARYRLREYTVNAS